MEAITQRFITPPIPVSPETKCIYPWEHTELMVLCRKLYEFAAQTGYTGTLDEFKRGFGAYLEANQIITTDDFERYTGQYEVIPLPLMQQILQTTNKVLEDDITIAPIPYAETSNTAKSKLE